MTDKEFLEEKEKINVEWKQLIYNGELQNYDVSNIGQIRNHTTKQEYKLSKIDGMKNTYEFIQIKLNDGKKVNTGIHRLIGIMFIPIPAKYLTKKIKFKDLVIDHIDDVRYHNIVTNLQWLTQEENTLKAMKNETNLRSCVISKKDAKKICKDLANGDTIYDVSQRYNYSESAVYHIRMGHTFPEISKNYKFPSKQISEDKVVKICELLSSGKSSTEVSRELGVPQSTVTHILCGNAWTQISKDYEFPNKKGMTEEKRKLIIRICEMLQDGKSPTMISKELGVGKSFVQHIAVLETHTDISKDYVFNYQKFKVGDETVHNICKDLESKKYNNIEVAERNNVSLSFVKSIKSRKSRKDISDNYTW